MNQLSQYAECALDLVDHMCASNDYPNDRALISDGFRAVTYALVAIATAIAKQSD